jgi:hypothetical protein
MPGQSFGTRHLGRDDVLKLFLGRAANFFDGRAQLAQNVKRSAQQQLAFALRSGQPPMTFLSDDRPLAFVTSAALAVYDTLTVAIWALLLFLVARRSGASLTRDLF